MDSAACWWEHGPEGVVVRCVKPALSWRAILCAGVILPAKHPLTADTKARQVLLDLVETFSRSGSTIFRSIATSFLDHRRITRRLIVLERDPVAALRQTASVPKSGMQPPITSSPRVSA
jgi:hypothetical protein